MSRHANRSSATKSEDGKHSKARPRARMAIPGPDIGTEYDSKGDPIPLRERLPEDREKVEELIAQAAASITEKRESRPDERSAELC